MTAAVARPGRTGPDSAGRARSTPSFQTRFPATPCFNQPGDVRRTTRSSQPRSGAGAGGGGGAGGAGHASVATITDPPAQVCVAGAGAGSGGGGGGGASTTGVRAGK